MKKLIALMLLLTAGYAGYTQCNKKVLFTSTKTEYLKADSTVSRTKDEHSTVEFDQNTILIIPGDDEGHKLTGTVNSYTCNWTTPFKEGKMVLKAVLTERDETRTVTITITGKDGQISFLAEAEHMPDRRIRLTAEKFEEKK